LATVLLMPASPSADELARGNELLRHGAFEAAAAKYSKAKDAEPWRLAPYLGAGEAYLRLGAVDQARAEFVAALHQAPRSAAIWRGLGRTEAAANDYRAAAAAYARTAELAGDSLSAYKAGRHYVQAQNLAEARIWLERSAALAEQAANPRLEAEARQTLALVLALDDPFAAESQAQRAVAIAPPAGYPLARSVLTACREAAASEDAAYRAALLGHAALGVGQVELADLLLRRAIAANPDMVDTHAHLALVLLARGDPGAARAAIDRALALDKEHPVARYARAVTLRAAGQTREAIADLRQMSAAIPAEPTFVIELAAAYADLGAYDRAGELLEQAVSLPGANATTYLVAAEFFLDRAFASTQAVVYARRAVEELGDDARAWESYGWALHLAGDVEALSAMKKAVELNAADARARYRLGAVYEKHGHTADAREHYGEAAGLDPVGAHGRRARAALAALLSQE
jgi:tetratricopeptide (TPR) repeat protein